MGEGGKILCGVEQLEKKGEACIIYSFGVSDDSSAELGEFLRLTVAALLDC